MPLLSQKENEELTAVATAALFEIFHLSMDVHSSSLSKAFEKGINQSKCKHLAVYKPPGNKQIYERLSCLYDNITFYAQTFRTHATNTFS